MNVAQMVHQGLLKSAGCLRADQQILHGICLLGGDSFERGLCRRPRRDPEIAGEAAEV